MAAWILAVVSVVFLLLASWRLSGADVRFHMQGRIWLMLGVIFGVVSAWLFSRG